MRSLRYPANAAALAVLFLISPVPATADAAQGEVHTLSAADLEGFLAPLMEQQLAQHHVAGAVAVIVKDGAVLFAKGYGLADREASRPMTADAALVRPGSISKLFTAIGVMQLVEQGELDLDRDVNGYLDFRIEVPEGGVPVTLRRLLTHRAGFEEHVKDLFSSKSIPEPLGQWLAHSQPKRLFPAGDVPAYSNYGVALAGYIVERASGEPYADYIARHILTPLGMYRSTFRQPLPEAFVPLAPKAYLRSDKPPLPFSETIAAAPAGALWATGTDMGRFMLALLNGGSLDGAQILREETLAQMMAPQVRARSGNLGLVFYETDIGGTRVIGHDGATVAFLSQLMLLPEHRFGLFVSYNGFRGIDPILWGGEAARAIVRRYFPSTPAPEAPPSAGEATAAAGVYQTSRRADSTMLRLSALASEILIRARSDGTLTLHSALWPFGAGYPMQGAGKDLYRQPQIGLMAFDAPAGVPRLTIGAPVQEFRPVPWTFDARIVVPAALSSLLAAALTLAAWPFLAIARWRGGRSLGYGAAARRGRLFARLVALEQLIAAAGFAVLYAAATANPTILNSTLDPVILVLYGLAWLGVAGAGISAWAALQIWRDCASGLWTRLHHTLLAMSALTLAWLFLTLGLAGTGLNY
jgi:CubicO group peptidase (beta-lactamase class C family)